MQAGSSLSAFRLVVGFCGAGPGAFGFLTLGWCWATLAGLSTVDPIPSARSRLELARRLGRLLHRWLCSFGSVLSGFLRNDSGFGKGVGSPGVGCVG